MLHQAIINIPETNKQKKRVSANKLKIERKIN